MQHIAKFLQKLTPGFKNPVRNLDNFRQAVENPRSWDPMGYFFPKNTFLHLKYYIQRIYLSDCNWTRTHNHLAHKRTLNQPVWLNGWVFFYELSGGGFESSCSHLKFRFPASSKEFLDIQAAIECGFTLKRVHKNIQSGFI